ncbi:MAG: tandem-95 repeat protein [Pseudomonadota bacterium]
MAVSFVQVGGFSNVSGFQGSNLTNPTSLQFGPDGRLYVSEQNGTINAYTVTIENGQYVATAHETLELPNGLGVVQGIQNHNDDGSEASASNRQVTGIVVTGTAENPVLYVSSSDPRISKNVDSNLDTNSGVVTKVSWNGSEWEAVDILRGLPRSEENHSVNGMVLDEDTNSLYLTIGGNTNNGAPSKFFAYTGEYALSGTVIEIDLDDIESRDVLVDSDGGQGNTARSYVYDLPTLDDPTILNADGGGGEDANGMDEDGPWGGNDGLNMGIVAADAPFRIFADGLRNAYDLAMSADGKLYTLDNGSNLNLGDYPNVESPDDDGDGITGEALNTPNDGGEGQEEPLFYLEDGGYYGHAAPVRANQNQSWSSYNDNGVAQVTVPDLSAQVPTGVNIAPGFVIDPSKFTGDPTRLAQSGVEIADREDSPALTKLFSSSNGLLYYDSKGQAFDGALDGSLIVTQQGGDVVAMKLNADGTALEAIVDPGDDGVLGTGDDFVPNGAGDGNWVLPGIGLEFPLDVTQGPDGTLWIASLGGDNITIFAPSGTVLPDDPDFDNDGIFDIADPFIRDAENGTSLEIAGGETYLWDFAESASGSTPGPDGYGGGLTGVMINGTTDFEEFFAEEVGPNQTNLNNVKFTTAALGGATVIEAASQGDPNAANNNGEFLFHTGVKVGETVSTFNVKWTMLNPGSSIVDNFQQIGGYIGTGDQSNYLKIVGIEFGNGGGNAKMQVALENNDSVSAYTIDIPDLFAASVVDTETLTIELLVDVEAETALPSITYITPADVAETVVGTVVDLSGTNVMAAINGEISVQGQETGLAVGLFSTNFGAPAGDAFQAVFDDIEITTTEKNVAPVAEDDSTFAGVDETIIIPVADLLANDTDPNAGDTLAIVDVDSSASNGFAVLNDNGTPGNSDDDFISFTPSPEFEGSTSFDYTVEDSGGLQDVGTVEITVSDTPVLYRVNSGGPELGATDGLINWEEDTSDNNSQYLLSAGSNNATGFPAVSPGGNVPSSTPGELFDTERWDTAGGAMIQYGFPVTDGFYEVRLFVANGFDGTSGAGSRVFDIEIEGGVITSGDIFKDTDDIDLSGQFGHQVGAMISNVVEVTDGTLNIDLVHGSAQNPLINGIEILQAESPDGLSVSITGGDQTVSEADGTVQISMVASDTVPEDQDIDVTFEIVPGTATPGVDYDYTESSAQFDQTTGIITDTVTIAGGSSDLQPTIQLLQDTIFEFDEAFTVNIVSVSGNATVGANNTATVTITDDDPSTVPGQVLVRINSGGNEVASNDAGPNWSADTAGQPTPFLTTTGSNTFGSSATINVDPAETNGVPAAIFNNERFDPPTGEEMSYAFSGLDEGNYRVNLYMAEGSGDQSAPGARNFDVAVEGSVPTVFDEITPFDTYGNDAFVLSYVATVVDGTLNLDFLHDGPNNPAIRGIEIIAEGPVDAVDSVDGVAVPGEDFSSDPAAPDTIVLPAEGTTTIVSNLEGGNGDRDFVNVLIPNGYRLVEVILDDYQADEFNAGFLGLKEGNDFVIDPAIPALGVSPDGVVEGTDLDGGVVYDQGDIGSNLLPLMNVPGAFDGFDADGLTGSATFWFNQGGGASETTITFVTEEDPLEPGDTVIAINAGGPALVQDSTFFVADIHFNNGITFTDNGDGNGLQPVFDGTIYETERYNGNTPDALSYSIPVPEGEYLVDLYFAEIFLPNGPGTGIGDRVMDVFIEGSLVLDDLDILAETGGDPNTPFVYTTPVSVSPSDGDNPTTLDISFDKIANNAKVSGIGIRLAEPLPPTGGEAVLTVTENSDNVQISNFGNGSFSLTNTGNKNIAKIEIDVSNAIFTDAVFDPFGVAGDTIAKLLTLGSSSTGAIAPDHGSNANPGSAYIGAGGSDGFEGIQILFDDGVDGGFNPGETLTWAVDMDPNSIAGAEKSVLDPGASPAWDIGGISGAELIGSEFTVTFTDGTTATGQLGGANNQGGSKGLASQNVTGSNEVMLTVNGLDEGGVGTYSDGGPAIIVEGPAGATVRVVVAKGIIQPVTNEFFNSSDPADQSFGPVLDAQLAALAASDFPANNAAEFLTVDVVLDGTAQNISNLFDFSQVSEGAPLAVNEAQVPLGVVASLIDPDNNDLPLGPVTDAVYLTYAENNPPTIDPVDDVTVDEGDTVVVTVMPSDLDGDLQSVDIEIVRDSDGAIVDPGAYTFEDLGNGDYALTWQPGEADDGSYTATVSASDNAATTTETFAINVNELPDPQPGDVLYRVNAGGNEVAATDGGPAWSQDTTANNSPFLVNAGSNNQSPNNVNNVNATDITGLAGTGMAEAVMGRERWDKSGGDAMAYAFEVEAGTEVEVRIYLAEHFQSIPDANDSNDASGDRVFNIAVDGVVPQPFFELDPFSLAGGFGIGTVVSHTMISDGLVDLEFLHGVENPAVKAIELKVAGTPDEVGPTAVLDVSDITTIGSEHTFTVTFSDDTGLDVSTIDDLDLVVSNALGDTFDVSLVSVDVNSDGTPREATYSVSAPDGSFDPDDNGTYTVTLSGAAVSDILGNSSVETELGTFDVAVPDAKASALLQVGPGTGLTASTFSNGSFILTNNSEDGVTITSLEIDLSSGVLPDMVWDPTGSGGDATAKGLEANSGAVVTGFVVPADNEVDPFSQARNGGFDVLSMAFTDFDPNETFTWTVDVDPNSIQNVPGAGAAGSVSGYELIGATVSITFSNGETVTGPLFEEGSLGGSEVVLEATDLSTPTIDVVGAPADESSLPGTQVSVASDPTIRVSGTEGDNIALLQMDSRLFIASGDAPFIGAASGDELPFYANEAMDGKVVHTAVIGAGGFVDIPVSLLETDGGGSPDGGLNQFIAVSTGAVPYAVGTVTSAASNILTIKQSADLVYDAPGVMTFDGTANTVIELPHDPNWEISEGTIAFSFNAATTAKDQGLFTKDASFFEGGGNHALIYLDKSTLVARFQDGENQVLLEFPGIEAGVEYEVAATFGADGIELWVDGNLVGSDPLVMDWTEGPNIEWVQWGGRGWSSATGEAGFDAPFEGTISDKQIYSSVLDASLIAALAGSSAGTNSAPTPVDDDVAATEDTAAVIALADLLSNDSDPDGDTVSFDGIVVPPANGALVDNLDGTLTYTPDANFNGSDGFAITVSDGNGGVAQSNVFVTVAAVNDDPTAVNDEESVVTGTSVVVALLANDSDVDGDGLILASVSDGANGTVVNNNDGTVTYTPTGAFTGTDTFSYTISDGNGGEATASVTMLVLAEPNADPVAANDAYSTNEDVPLTVAVTEGVLDNDTDTNGDPLTASVTDDVDNGTLALNSDGSFTYTPDADFNGTDTFTYAADDGKGGIDTAEVSITVNPVNDDPVANNDVATTAEDITVSIDVLGNDTDADGDDLLVSDVTQGANGTVGTDGSEVTYTPDPGFTGEDSFTYDVSDGEGGVDTATVTVTVTDVPDFPQPVFTQDGVTEYNGSAGAVDNYAPDPALNIPQGTITFSFCADDPGDRQGLVVRDANQFEGGGNHFMSMVEKDTLRVRFQDESNSAEFIIPGINGDQEYEVAAFFGPDGVGLYLDGVLVGFDPTVTPDLTNSDQWLNVGGLGWSSDDGDSSFTNPLDGKIVDLAVFDVVLTAEEVAELAGKSSATNSDPTPTNDAATTDEDNDAVIAIADLLSNDSDPDGDPVSFAGIASQPGNGSVQVAGGNLTYTPDDDFNGQDLFEITVEDGNGGSATSTVLVTVNPVNDDPTAVDDEDTAVTGEGVTIDVVGNDSDVDGDTLMVASVTDGSNGTVANNNDGTVTYTASGGFTGTDSFTYTVSDGNGGEATGSVSVLVLAEPNADPVAVDDSYNATEDTTLTVEAALGVSSNDTDSNGDPLMVTVLDDVDSGTLVLDADGGFTYTPDAEFNGTDTFTYTVDDGKGGTDVGEATITVAAVADDPVAVNDADTTEVNTAVTIDVLDNDSDPDGDLLTVAGVGQGANGTVTFTAGDVTYTPDADFVGEDSFTYDVSDGQGGTDQATVTVTVEDVPDFPTPVFSQPGLTEYNGSSGSVDNYAPNSTLQIPAGTIAFSFETDNDGARQGLVVKDANQFEGGGNHFMSMVDKDELRIRFQDGVDEFEFKMDIEEDTEYEVASTFDASGVAVWIDGVLMASSSDVTTDLSTNVEWLNVGGLGWSSDTGSASFTNPFDGEIADVEFYDSVLTQEQIETLAAISSFDT